MKNLIILLVLIATTISCSETQKNKTQNDTYLKATIDGVDFYADAPSNLSSLNNFTILAKDKNGAEIKIFLDETRGPGTYTLGEGKISFVYTENKVNWIASKVRGKGSIITTEEGKYLMGKFSITATNDSSTNNKQIIRGEFKVINKNKKTP